MGNSESKDIDSFKENYKKHNERKDPRYGNVSNWHSRNNPQDLVLIKNKWTNSPNESQEINALIDNRKDIYHPNLAQCHNYSQEKDRQFFNTFHKHNMAFEYHDNNLEKEIRSRNNFNNGEFQENKKFSEPEMWYMSNGVINVDCLLAREGGSYHGDIQPSTLLFDEKNKIKTIDSSLIHLNKSTYSRMLYDRNVKAPLSPLLCQQMAVEKVNPVNDPSKEESWALGMTMLCAGTNTKLDDYYDWKVPEVRRHVVNENLDKLDGPYSKKLHGFVESCLEESEENRPSMEDHQKDLQSYQKEATDIKLDFKDRRKEVIKKTLPPPPPPPKLTTIIDEDDFFGNGPKLVEVVNNRPPSDKIIMGGGNFFEQKERVERETDVYNFFS